MKSTNPKIAIVHDVLIQPGGAERVLDLLLNIYPSADIFTSINSYPPQLANIQKLVKKSWKGIPFINEYRTISKLFIHFYWESLDLSEYDIVISSSDEFSSKSIITSPKTLHICYLTTPPRFLYPEYPDINELPAFSPFLRRVLLLTLRQIDFVAAQRIDKIVTISETVQSRIKKYYRRDSVVIYPPVEVPQKMPNHTKADDYYIYIGALENRKGVALAIRACKRLKKRLVIIGEGREEDNLKKISGKTTKFTGYLDGRRKIEYLKKAKGFIFPSIDEDFGIAPVEAMAHGVPVIAYYSGGARETVVEGKTGIFFRNHNEKDLIDAIGKFENMKFSNRACYNWSKKFSEKNFKDKIYGFIEKTYEEQKNQ